MQILSDNAIGKGFGQLPEGYIIETFDQFYHSGEQDWKISTFFTSDKEINKGRTIYRRPMTFGAKYSVFWSVVGKIWRKKVKTFIVNTYLYIGGLTEDFFKYF